MSEREPDTTIVRCPNGCLDTPGHDIVSGVPREFRWASEAGGGIGENNYCRECGTELIEA